MTSCKLVRVFSSSLCKKKNNQNVEALKKELELKKKDIEEKDTKLNTLLQYPFSVIKLLATQYFNLRRRVEEPSNVRTRQTIKEQLSEEQLKQLSEIEDFLLEEYEINIENCYVNNSKNVDDFVNCCVNTYTDNNKEDVEFTTTIENDTLTKEMVEEKIPKETVKVYSVSIEGYKTIGEEAFDIIYNTVKLTTLVIGNSVENIGDIAFAGCSNLEELVIGNSVETIGYGAFYMCKTLKELVIGNSVKTIGDGAFFYCENLKELVIGNSVKTIGDSAFYRPNLEELVIGNSVKTIGDSAFYYCENLEELVIGNSVETIGDDAFYYCKKLKELVIPDSVKTIGRDAFFKSELNKVIISDATAKKLNPNWTSPGTVSSFYGSSKPVEFILPEV